MLCRLTAPLQPAHRGNNSPLARFGYLDETIALILAFVGIKILVTDLVHISDLGSLAIIGALLVGGVLASLAADRLDPPHPVEEATRRPPRCPRKLTRPTPPASTPRGAEVGAGEQDRA
jgi:hypothetical protein